MTLELDGVAKSYPAHTVGPLDIAVGGEVLCVLGPSGCGKTTLLSLVAGIVRPDEGTIVLDGRILDGRLPEERGTAIVFQDGALFPHMTVRENVAYAADGEGAVRDLADRLELDGLLDRRAGTLSGGERQRVALARSIAADPDALLLDEPLANLDAPIKRRLRAEMQVLLSSLSVPVVYVTHDQHEASVVGDRIAVMADGTIHQVGTPAAVFDRPATRFVASFTGSANVSRATTYWGDDGLVLDWDGVRMQVSDPGGLAADDGAADPGTDVWFTVRPEYVSVEPAGGATDANTFDGTIERRVFEGDGYVLSIGLDDVDEGVEARLPGPAYDSLQLGPGDRVRVGLPPGAIHVIGPVG